MPDCHTLVVSDIHLGSRVCRAEKILSLLREARFKELIVNGDLFDSDSAGRLDGSHWSIVAELSDIAVRRPVYLVGGNHGRKLDPIARRMGLQIVDGRAFTVGHRRFLCLHGDEFDFFTTHMPATSELFTYLYYLIQKAGGDSQRLSMLLKRFSKKILGISRRQQRLAMAEGAKEGADVIICSHTHLPHVGQKDGVLFVNSGSFCDATSTYITIDRSGKVELCDI